MQMKKIAVIMSALAQDNQRKLFNGMIKAGKETGCNLYFFSNYINFSEKGDSEEGSYHIMKLPDFKEFDGAIIAKNIIRHQETAEYVTKKLQESGIPSVSVDVDIPGMSEIGVSTYEAQMEIIEHLIEVHNCKDIYYIAGPQINLEGKKRYKAYCDTLKKHNLEYKEDHVFFGDFNIAGGCLAGEKFLANGNCPEAVVCANDDTAIGFIEYMEEKGYRVPLDIKVTGFDDAEFSRINNPPLTTIDKNQKECGYQAVYELLALIDGKPVEKHQLSCRLKLRRSCGCKHCEEIEFDDLKKIYRNDRILTQRFADMIRNMASRFSGMEKPEELLEELKVFVLRIMDMDAFYVCLCDRDRVFMMPDDNMSGSLDINQINKDYTDEITIPVAYENGEFTSYGPFSKKKVLPEECQDKTGGNYYIFSPINYLKVCYGYCAIKNSRFPVDNLLYYSWLVNIGIGLENIRKWMLLKNTVVKLNGVWAYDMMTHLYNRAGFYHNVKNLLLDMQKNDKEAFLLFMDIDGLKVANDTMGHEIGDWMIREMAEVVKMNLTDNQVAMRYGGDEFVIFGSVESETQMQELPNSLRSSMKSRNLRNDNLFELKASIGISTYRAKDIVNLDTLIEAADKKMYEEKRRRKAEAQNK